MVVMMNLLQRISCYTAILAFCHIGVQYNRLYYHTRKTLIEDYSQAQTRIFIFMETRPEIIKLAPIIQTFTSSGHFEVRTIFMGQQPDLIKPFLRLFNITLNLSLDCVMEKNQSLPMLISKIMMMAEKHISHR